MSILGLSVGFPKVLNASRQVGCLGALASHGRQMTVQILIQTHLTFIPRLRVSYNRLAIQISECRMAQHGRSWRDPRSNHRLSFLGMLNFIALIHACVQPISPTEQCPVVARVPESMYNNSHQIVHPRRTIHAPWCRHGKTKYSQNSMWVIDISLGVKSRILYTI